MTTEENSRMETIVMGIDDSTGSRLRVVHAYGINLA